MTFLTSEVMDKVLEATREGIDLTTQAAAEEAKGTTMELPLHEAAGYYWFGTTPRVEDAVVVEAAQVSGSSVLGKFGSTTRRGEYALLLERMNPYLRPAADRTFTSLAENIRERLDG
jgi:hypothetical protein